MSRAGTTTLAYEGLVHLLLVDPTWNPGEHRMALCYVWPQSPTLAAQHLANHPPLDVQRAQLTCMTCAVLC